MSSKLSLFFQNCNFQIVILLFWDSKVRQRLDFSILLKFQSVQGSSSKLHDIQSRFHRTIFILHYIRHYINMGDLKSWHLTSSGIPAYLTLLVVARSSNEKPRKRARRTEKSHENCGVPSWSTTKKKEKREDVKLGRTEHSSAMRRGLFIMCSQNKLRLIMRTARFVVSPATVAFFIMRALLHCKLPVLIIYGLPLSRPVCSPPNHISREYPRLCFHFLCSLLSFVFAVYSLRWLRDEKEQKKKCSFNGRYALLIRCALLDQGMLNLSFG